MPPRPPPPKGKRRCEIKKIERAEARQVCFSKRKAGIFKKAGELSILCGAEIGAVVFSPSGRKVFSFGHPSIETVASRFLGEPWSEAGSSSAIPHHMGFEHLSRQHRDLCSILEEEEKTREAMQKKLKELGGADGLGLEEVEKYRSSVELLLCRVGQRVEELRFEEAMAGPRFPMASI